MSAVPAWKKLGLKQSKPKQQQSGNTQTYDPLKEGLKRTHESGETKKTAKPPKRQKVKKSEKPAPTHELDQLAYLRQYTESKETWKFSKQKQNWVLKHMFTDQIQEKYDEALINYILGLQGSSRTWALDESKNVIEKWNKFMQEDALKKEEAKEEEADKGSADSDSDTNSKPKEENEKENEKTKNKKPRAKPVPKPDPKTLPPTERLARRAQTIVERLSGEKLSLELLDSI